jgi:hypothetical protein
MPHSITARSMSQIGMRAQVRGASTLRSRAVASTPLSASE